MGSSRRTEGKTSATMHRWAVLLALVLLALVPSLLCLPTAYVYQWKNPTVFNHYQSPPQLVQPHYFATRPSLSKPTSSFLKPESVKTLTRRRRPSSRVSGWLVSRPRKQRG